MMKKKYYQLLTMMYIFFLPCVTLAQNSNDYLGALSYLFFDRNPSARAEALGRCYTAVGEDVSVVLLNPAGLAFVDGISFTGSLSSPWYTYINAKYQFFGLSCQLGKYGVFGLSRYRFDSSKENYLFDDSSREITTRYVLSYSIELVQNLSFGFNLNYIQQEFIISDVIQLAQEMKGKSYPIDIGISKIILFPSRGQISQKISFAASLSNVTYSKISYFENEKDALPVVFRFGTSYQLSFLNPIVLSNLDPIRVILTIEYQDLLNSKFYSGLKYGTELLLLEIFAIRAGSYRLNYNDRGYSSNMDELKNNTFGFGFQLPIFKFINRKIPLHISFDYTKLPQPKVVRAREEKDFSVYAISIKWNK